jgi:predicted ATPase
MINNIKVCDMCNHIINEEGLAFPYFETDSGNKICPNCCCIALNALSAFDDKVDAIIDKTVYDMRQIRVKGANSNDNQR